MLDLLLSVGDDACDWHRCAPCLVTWRIETERVARCSISSAGRASSCGLHGSACRGNMVSNSSHYSALVRWLGPRAAVEIASRLGVGVHFNSMVPFRFRSGSSALVKYGTASDTTTLADLLTWDSMYIAGRLQKPVSRALSSTLEDGGR